MYPVAPVRKIRITLQAQFYSTLLYRRAPGRG